MPDMEAIVKRPKGLTNTKRAEELRSTNKRPTHWTPPGASAGSVFTSDMLGPDKVVRWIRLYINSIGLEDKAAFFKRIERGWTPVTPEDLKEVGKSQPHLEVEGTIQRDGCILMKNDKEFAAADVKFWEDRALGSYESMMEEMRQQEEGDRRNRSSVIRTVETATSQLRGRRPL